MKFDDITVVLGEFGKYQKLLYCTVCVPAIFNAFNVMITVFTLATPQYRCAIPGLQNDTFQLLGPWHEELINRSIPLLGDTESTEVDTCHVYASKANETRPVGTRETCEEWVFDKSIFEDTFITKFQLVCGHELARAHANSLVMVGILIGASTMGVVSDAFGRKKAFMASSLLLITAFFGVAFSPNFKTFAAFRFLGGFAESTYTIAFTMAMEIVGPSYRVAGGIFIDYFWCVGLFLLCALAFIFRSASTLSLAVACPTVILLFYLWVLPESPRWLISKGRYKEAETIIRKIAKVNKVKIPENIVGEDSVEKPIKVSVLKMFTIPKLLMRTLIIYFNWCVVVMVYYGLSLNVGNLGGDIYVNFALNSLMEVVAYTVCVFTLDRFGRKKLHVSCLLLGGLSCLCTIFTTQFAGDSLNWMTVTLANIGKFGVSASFAVVYVWTAELFPTTVRTSGLGSSSMAGRVGSIVCPYIVELRSFVKGGFGEALPLLIFGGLAFAAGLMALKLPETAKARLPDTIEDAVRFGRRPCDEDIDINIIDKSANIRYYSTVPGELGNHTTIH